MTDEMTKQIPAWISEAQQALAARQESARHYRAVKQNMESQGFAMHTLDALIAQEETTAQQLEEHIAQLQKYLAEGGPND